MALRFWLINCSVSVAGVVARQLTLKSVPQTRTGALFAILYLVVPGGASADDTLEELKACASMNDDTARVACYEELGSRVLGERAAESDVDAVATADDRVKAVGEAPSAGDTLADDLGGKGFAKNTQNDVATNRGRMTSCRKGPDGKWNFFFENGQRWKQSGGRRHRFKNCDYYVTISKDPFGYRMQIDGEDRKYRIRRMR